MSDGGRRRFYCGLAVGVPAGLALWALVFLAAAKMAGRL